GLERMNVSLWSEHDALPLEQANDSRSVHPSNYGAASLELWVMRNVDFARQPAHLLLIAMMTAALASPQAARRADAVLDEIRAHHSGIAVWWVGNAGWLIKSGDLLISTDLDLSMDEKIQAPPITARELAAELDIAFVSHHHGDHCNVPTIKELARASRCTFVLPRPCLK